MSTEEKIYKQLAGDEMSREILRFCASAKSTEEIISRIVDYYRTQRGWDWYKTLDARDSVGTRLNNLEKIGAISYEQNKWKTQEIALSVMRKYFGV